MYTRGQFALIGKVGRLSVFMMKRDCLSQSQSTARTAITIMIEAIAASGLKEVPRNHMKRRRSRRAFCKSRTQAKLCS